jgi:hypothetical protein
VGGKLAPVKEDGFARTDPSEDVDGRGAPIRAMLAD